MGKSHPTAAQQRAAQQTATVELTIDGRKLRVQTTVPTRPTIPIQLLPQLRTLAETFIGDAIAAVEAEGEHIACRAGCGACCRQLVPISAPEAHRLHAVVEAMPEPRRTQIRARFAAAREQLQKSGLLQRLRDGGELTGAPFRELGLAYFAQGLACPFLEDESCSIYAERPIICREYLVVSAPEHCAQLGSNQVRSLKMPASVSTALATLSTGTTQWIPLTLALEWAEQHPDHTTPRPGTEWLRELFSHLTGKAIP